LHNPLATRNATDSTIMLDHTSNSTITNLTFVGGGDPITPNGKLNPSGEFSSAIDLQNGSNHNTIQDNRFQGCQGDTCIVLSGGHLFDADNNNIITGNTFSSCTRYALAIVDGNDNYFGKNWLRDCSLGSEMDAGCTQTNAGNQYVDNVMQNVNGVALYLGGSVCTEPIPSNLLVNMLGAVLLYGIIAAPLPFIAASLAGHGVSLGLEHAAAAYYMARNVVRPIAGATNSMARQVTRAIRQEAGGTLAQRIQQGAQAAARTKPSGPNQFGVRPTTPLSNGKSVTSNVTRKL
jgi:hypothetical protein